MAVFIKLSHDSILQQIRYYEIFILEYPVISNYLY